MAFGIQTVNGSDELTFSSDAITFGYVGKAVLVTTVQPGTATLDSFSGYSEYTITWASEIVVAAAVTTASGGTALVSMTRSGSTWTIRVFNGGNSTNSLGFDVQVPTDVYVWGRPTSVSGFGMALYDAAGTLSGDLSRRPFRFEKRGAFAAGVNSIPLSGFTKPAIVGNAGRRKADSVFVGGSPGWVNRLYLPAWLWDIGVGQLARVNRQQEYFMNDGGIPVLNDSYAANALVIEASGLT